MTLAEFVGCSLLTFGLPLSMFVFTIAPDAMRVIIMLIAAFFWLCSLVVSAFLWFILLPLRDTLIIGIVCTVLIQEAFRYLLFITLRKADRGLREVADHIQISDNKHMLAYVCGLGFGTISGIFSMANLLADASGPATMGLNGGTQGFFLATAAQSLCMILMHVFWSVTFFNGCDKRKWEHIIFVVVSHLFVSCMSLWNGNGNAWYAMTIPLFASMTMVSCVVAFKIAGGSYKTLKRFVRCQ